VYCWQFATSYHLIAMEQVPGPFYENIADTYVPTLQHNHAGNWQAISQAECGSAKLSNAAGFVNPGDFDGYPTSPGGYPAALRTVVAAAIELNQPWAQLAWSRLINAPRQPSFTQHPAFAILPHQ
jgi:hypothetical protein